MRDPAIRHGIKKSWPRLSVSIILAILAVRSPAQQPYQPTPEEWQQLRARLGTLAKDLAQLRARKADEALIADVAVYHKAGEWIARHPEEFYTRTYLTNTWAALERGHARAAELLDGKPSWTSRKGRLVRAYRSRVDDSIQPYGLIIPDSYDARRPTRLDVILHGRGNTLNEVSFIAAHDSTRPVPAEQNFIQLEVFGRTNNAYRWSGETDVLEAVASVKARYHIDPDRVVLRGFSMGGAGAWHMGLHYPDQWAAVEAGAGFTETQRYAHLDNLPAYQDATRHIYDAVGYSLNAFNVPTVGYGGEIDPQRQASVNIREQLAKEGFHFIPEGLNWRAQDLRARFLVGPQTAHRWHPDSQRASDAFIDEALVKGRVAPDHIRFVTWTTRYNRCFWITVDGLERHYERADVDAEWSPDHTRLTVRTRNIARLILTDRKAGQTVVVDKQTFALPAGPARSAERLLFEKRNRTWMPPTSAATAAARRKRHGLQGPIDDAFMDSFLCVRPTGKPNHPLVNDYAQAALARFAGEYDKWLRADVRVKDDRDVTNDDIARHHLILFGDPASNRLLARISDQLPIRWSKDRIIVGNQGFRAADHVAVLIYPNPLNPQRYVVVNSGYTFHEREFRGSNALLFPRLGDYAVLHLNDPPKSDQTGDVVRAGIFGENWELY